MDNLRVDVTAVGRDALKAALSILYGNAAGGLVRHYVQLKPPTAEVLTLVLLWGQERDSLALPVPLDLDGATDLAWRWLAALEPRERGSWIDMDGDCLPEAFRVFCDDWGHVHGWRYGVAGIQGHFAWYGK